MRSSVIEAAETIRVLEFLADAARNGVLAGCEESPDCAGGLSLSAALFKICASP